MTNALTLGRTVPALGQPEGRRESPRGSGATRRTAAPLTTTGTAP
ncbi:hypothetical protein [Streptomyces sp. cmx-4-9]